MNFKDQERHKREWWELSLQLRLILTEIEVWLDDRGHVTTITDLIRTEQEQKSLFDSGATTLKVSPHQFGRAADLRITAPRAVLTEMADVFNAKYVYDPKRPNMKTVLRHDGSADHLHIQVLT